MFVVLPLLVAVAAADERATIPAIAASSASIAASLSFKRANWRLRA